MGGVKQGTPLTLAATVSTFAGASVTGGSVDGTGIMARFSSPNDITTDGTNLYVADTANATIRKIVIATGLVTTLAGSAGLVGAVDGTGTTARFNSPYGITTDGSNLYVTDWGNHTIRKIVIASGAVTTLAGMAGVAGTMDGTGAAARFSFPFAITTDGTNLYEADTGDSSIRKIVIATGLVTSTVPTGTQALGARHSITTDGINLYVADSTNNNIRKLVMATGVLTTLAGSGGIGVSVDGTGLAASFTQPEGITTDGTNLYVTDGNIIRKIVIATGTVTTLAGGAVVAVPSSVDGIGAAASFNSPWGITTDGSNLYVVEIGNNAVRKIK